MTTIAILFAFAQAEKMINDPQLTSPQVSVEPVDTFVQKAVDKLKALNPSYFIGVRKIVIDMGQGYGRVESGPGKDPAVIHINLATIKNQLKSQLGNASQPEFEKELVRQIAETIAHEKGHIGSFNETQGFVGGEQPAEAEEGAIRSRLTNALP